MPELEEYIKKSVVNLSSFSQSFGNIVKKTIKENIKTLDYSQKAFEDVELVRRSVENIVNESNENISFMKYLAEKLKHTKKEYKPFFEKVFGFINNKLNKYIKLTESLDKEFVLHEIIKETGKNINGFVDKKSNLPLTLATIIKKNVSKYLSLYQQNNKTKIIIKNLWHKYIINEYYSGSSDDSGSLEQILIDKIIPETERINYLKERNKEKLSKEELEELKKLENKGVEKDWNKELLRRISLPKEENLIVSNFDNWFKDNYKRLVTDFYKWEKSRETPIPSFGGLIITSILDYLSTQEGDRIISRSKFENTAKKMINLLNNDNIKNILIKEHLDAYTIYEKSINATLRHYISYNPNENTLNEFAALITTPFLDLFKVILSTRIEAYEKNNGTYREKYARWLKGIYENIQKKLLKGKETTNDEGKTILHGIRESYYSDISIEEINDLFKIERLPRLDNVKRTRIYFGEIKRKITEIIKKDETGDKFGYMNVYVSPLMNKDDKIKLKTHSFIKEKWEEFKEMNFNG